MRTCEVLPNVDERRLVVGWVRIRHVRVLDGRVVGIVEDPGARVDHGGDDEMVTLGPSLLSSSARKCVSLCDFGASVQVDDICQDVNG